MIKVSRFAALASLCVGALHPSLCQRASAATFAELAKLLPDGSNAVVIVNAEAIYNSPLGQREGIQRKYADSFEASPLILPPSAQRGVMGTSLELATLRPDWEAAVMELSVEPSAGDIARRRNGRTDYFAGTESAWLGSKFCILKFAPRTFGVITPTTRQEAAQWAADVKAGTAGELAPYLAEAVANADREAIHVILAIDLAEAFTAANLQAAIVKAPEFKGIAPADAAVILASVRGAKIGVSFSESMTGRLQLDFASDVAPLAAMAKPIILKAVGKAGAMLPEFATWEAKTGPKSLALEGPLTEDGMRRIFSVLSIDAAAMEAQEPEKATTTTVSAADQKKAMGVASLRYFRGVNKYIDDIDRLQKASSLDQAVMWIENYARHVDNLPKRNVDPDLLQYGNYVSQTFRAIVDQASGAISQWDAAGAPVVTNYRIGLLPTARTVNYGGDFQRMYAPFGYEDIDPQATQQNIEKSQQQIDQAVAEAQKSLKQLVSDNQTVRSKMTARYGVQF
jgi:hypothetical protein